MRREILNYSKTYSWYSKYPNDPSVKNHHYKLLRKYTKARKMKYRTYKQSLLNQIENLYDEDPKKYWKLI